MIGKYPFVMAPTRHIAKMFIINTHNPAIRRPAQKGFVTTSVPHPKPIVLCSIKV
jgi:hypothetical protein